MDLPRINDLVRPKTRADLPRWRDSDALLAGGTGLFAEPHLAARRLIDLHALAWPPVEISSVGLRIAATCTFAELAKAELPPDWIAAALLPACCNALAASFKVWNAATIGGNLCQALPAAPMAALATGLDGEALVWMAEGERTIPMLDFIVAPQQTALRAGELLRAIDLPAAALRRRAGLRQASLTTYGRSAALLVATLDPADGAWRLVITASTKRPLLFEWPGPPGAALLDAIIADLPPAGWLDDVHGTPVWRRHMTRRLAAELLQELTA